MICSNCGGALTPTAVCLDCGTIRRKFDTFALIVGVAGIALSPVLALIAPIIISFFGFGVTGTNVITALSFIIPMSVASDAIFMAIRRRKTHKTAAALILGIIGVIIVIVSLLQWLL